MKKYILLSIFISAAIFVSAECLDFTNLRGDFVTCTYGNYYNPYSSIGIIDDGISSSSRHTVLRDKDATDPRTGNKLKVVPPGDAASVRLGNWNTGAQAESITYEYYVDQEENPILVFKYAAVMEDPGHTPSDQPHFKMEILDQDNKAVDSYCGEFDFIADQSLGWNSYNYSGTILWKDWTSVGLDLTDYAGQTIKIRFTTYDCERSGHYGYAYINVACAQKRIKSLECGASATTTLTAPDGFEYRWYKYDGGNNIVEMGTTQSINVPTDETQYYCEVNQSGKPTCSFVLQAKADPRLPLADFTYDKHPACVDTLYFTNISAVSKDGKIPNYPVEECDEYVWDLGDGRIIEGRDITMPVVYEHTGDYTISLTAKLTHGGCEHTKSRTVHMLGYADTREGVIYDTICDNESYRFDNQLLRTSGVYVERTQNNYGCDSITTLYLTVLKSFIKDREATICANSGYDFNGRIVRKEGVYFDTLQSVVTGCDSILRLKLNVMPSYYKEESATICSTSQVEWRNQILTKTGIYADTLKSEYGCDSIFCMKLTVNPAYLDEKSAVICDMNDYNFRGTRLNKTGQYYDTISTMLGCDSVFKLNLLAHPTFRDTTWAKICLGDNYSFRGKLYNIDGNYSDTVCDPNNADCAIYTLMLTTVARSTIFSASVDEACADDKSFNITYNYMGAVPIRYNLYFDETAQRLGFRNVVGAAFVDSIVVAMPQFANGVYLRPDIYNVRLELDNGTCNPSEGAYNLAFMIAYPSWVIEQNWNDVVAVLNSKYNGGYEFDDYAWYINDNIWMDSTSYIYSPQYLHQGDKVYAALQRKGENYKINTCPIIITDRTDLIIADEPYLTISRNINSRKIDVNSRQQGAYNMYDMTGRQIQSGIIETGAQTITVNQNEGSYIIHFVAEDGHTESHKFIIR